MLRLDGNKITDLEFLSNYFRPDYWDTGVVLNMGGLGDSREASDLTLQLASCHFNKYASTIVFVCCKDDYQSQAPFVRVFAGVEFAVSGDTDLFFISTPKPFEKTKAAIFCFSGTGYS